MPKESESHGGLCDVMMTCGHYFGCGLESPPIHPCTFFLQYERCMCVDYERWYWYAVDGERRVL